jgi:hypothetical protein
LRMNVPGSNDRLASAEARRVLRQPSSTQDADDVATLERDPCSREFVRNTETFPPVAPIDLEVTRRYPGSRRKWTKRCRMA